MPRAADITDSRYVCRKAMELEDGSLRLGVVEDIKDGPILAYKISSLAGSSGGMVIRDGQYVGEWESVNTLD